MLRRLQYSFNEDRRKSRDPALQALLYLIGEAAEGVTNTYEFRVKDMRPLWRSNPFLFRAFKLAVSKLLDALEPAGDIESPATLEITENVTLDLTAPNFVRDIYQTPETLAGFVAAGILQGLVRTAPPKKSDPHPTKWDYADHYDWDSARRDLRNQTRKGKAMKGHIRRRGENSFELKYEAGIDPRTGKRVTKYASVKGTKREAQAKLNELLVAVAKGSPC